MFLYSSFHFTGFGIFNRVSELDLVSCSLLLMDELS